MKIFGRAEGAKSNLISLDEVTLVVNRDDLVALSSFIQKCIVEMGENPEWEHSHFNDFTLSKKAGGLVIFSETALPKP